MRAFFDANISYRIAQALSILAGGEHEVVALRDWPGSGGDESVKDGDFLPRLKAEGNWIVFTADLGRRDGDWHVWLASGLTIVFLKKWKMPLELYTAKLLTHWRKVITEVINHPTGTCFYLYPTGHLEPVRRRTRQTSSPPRRASPSSPP